MPQNYIFFAEVVVGTCLDQTAKFGRLNCSQVRAGRAAAAAVRMGVSAMNIFLLIIFFQTYIHRCVTHTPEKFSTEQKKKNSETKFRYCTTLITADCSNLTASTITIDWILNTENTGIFYSCVTN